ncbi:hypothetical protein HIM_07487 [Hirsutella minnesotensis 3608]|uniref:Short-chain dehydrogenase/reductase 3 n=1 Tax=Hirsutella minnesotensis 3608 TaxID=1043627 RepID=A0A0F7ZTH1_9HYPO|nr:hypothetical protein HIM_07487 [Hirsutella minnesotensis 3608]
MPPAKVVPARALLRHDAAHRLGLAAAGLAVVRTVLLVLVGLGTARFVNNVLSLMAANSWRLTPAATWNWPDEIAVVTGGSSGIGAGVVQRLAGRHMRVAVLDIQELPKEMQGNPLVYFYKCDITSPESVAEAADAVRRDIGHPSILINNAGITRPMPILKMPSDFLHKIFNVNCLSHWTLVQQFLPNMIHVNKGHVVTVASIASFVALAKAADYSATKAAAHAFHEALSTELRHLYKADGVLTSIAHPNFVRTPLVEDFANGLETGGIRLLTTDYVADEIAGQVFSKRGGQLVIPQNMTFLAGLRAWPTWMQTLVRDILGKMAMKL